MLRVARAHVEGRTIILPDLKLIFMPIPKAAWTAMLWALAPLAGMSAETFERSTKPEISPEMAVHDMRIWAAHGFLLRDVSENRRAEVLRDPEWLRFTVVRDPAQRLWSGWQSKILLQEPLYYGFHRDKGWFPRPPSDAADIVSDFRSFIQAMSDGFGSDTKMRDAHWGPQTDAIDLLPLNHIGRFEEIATTQSVLQEHVAKQGGPALHFARANASALPYDPLVFDEPSRATVDRIYRRDYAELGYPQVALPSATDLEQWAKRVEPQFGAMRDLVARHQRLYTVVDSFRQEQREAEAQARRLQRRAAKAEEQKELATRELERLQRRYDRIKQSMSWRVTAPLRWVRSGGRAGSD
jgi:hypothetical protein